MSKPFVVLLALLACLATLCVAQSRPTGKEIQFTFNPPDGTRYIQTQKTYRAATVPGSNEKQTREGESRSQFLFRKTDTGYDVVITALSVSASRDGKPLPADAVTQAMALVNVPITYKIALNGELQAVEGTKDTLDRVLRSVPSESQKAIRAMLTPEAMLARLRAEWNGRTVRFSQMSGEIGDLWTSEDPVPLLTGGQATFYTVTELAGTVACGSNVCARIKMHYNSNPAELGKAFTSAMDALVPKGEKLPAVTDFSIVGEGEFIVDPSTLLPRKEKIERTITMMMDIPGKGRQPVKTFERRESTFEYVKK